MPNRLGRVLRYVTEAVDYAVVPWRQAPMPVWSASLSAMVDRDKWRQPDTVDTDAAIRLAVTSSWAYTAIKLIADRVSSSDAWPRVKKREGEKLVSVNNHPFEQLLLHPNSLMTTDFILSYLTWWVMLYGNGYLFVSTPAPGYGFPEELWPLPSNAMRPMPETMHQSKLPGGGLCVDYEYTVGSNKFRLPGENVVHIRLPNPFDYWNGMSPLTAALMGLKIDNAEEKYVYSYYTEDNAIPPAIISLPAETSPTDFEAAKENIRTQFAGKHRTAITRNGELSVQVIQQTLEAMQHIETRKFNRDQIFMVYGIPDGMISGGVSGDSRLATEIAFTRNTVQPYLNRIASEFTANIAPYYGPRIVIDAPIIIPQDRALNIQEYSVYSQDMTINENREKLSLPALNIQDIVAQINLSREQADLDPIELADGTIDLLMALPTRLHAYISSNTFSSPMPPAYSNGELPAEVGDLPGMMGPDNFTTDQAVRAAIHMAVTTEMKRWEKVAMREARDGRNPADKVFVSPVLADTLIDQIRLGIEGKTEDQVKGVFDAYFRSIGGAGRDTPALPA